MCLFIVLMPLWDNLQCNVVVKMKENHQVCSMNIEVNIYSVIFLFARNEL